LRARTASGCDCCFPLRGGLDVDDVPPPAVRVGVVVVEFSWLGSEKDPSPEGDALRPVGCATVWDTARLTLFDDVVSELVLE
jgi:hypothetical protein